MDGDKEADAGEEAGIGKEMAADKADADKTDVVESDADKAKRTMQVRGMPRR